MPPRAACPIPQPRTGRSAVMTALLKAMLAAVLVLVAAQARPAAADGSLPYGEGLLWQVEIAGTPPSYVLGTMHAADPRVRAVLSGMTTVLDRVDSVTVEVEMTTVARARVTAAMFSLSPVLADRLPPDDHADLIAITAGYGLPEAMASRLQPWGAIILLAMPPAEYRRMAAGEPPMDQHLQEEAEARGLPVHQLETIGEQIAALSALPDDAAITLLRDAIAEYGDSEAQFEAMVADYVAGDLAGLRAQTETAAGDHPAALAAFLDHLLYRRNKTMADRMETRLAEGNALIAVGALHLPGERGVLALLAERGYTVKRVR